MMKTTPIAAAQIGLMKKAKIHSDGRNTTSCSSVFMWTRNTRSNASFPLTAGAAMLYLLRATPTCQPNQKNCSSAATVTIAT